VDEFDKCSIGWGGSTKNSVERLKNGVSPFDSGNPSGAGNGVAMKVMPIGLKMVADFVRINKSTKDSFAFEKKWDEYRWGVYRNTVHLALMTHRSAIAAASALSQIEAAFVALRPDPEYAFDSQFMNPIVEACWIAQSIVLNDKIPDKLSYRMVMLNEEARFKGKSVAEMAEMFGGATCYVYNSLPFCYAAFLYGRRKSTSLLYDVASAGGDTDSNASIVGGLQGALYGSDLFPKHLIDGLWNKERVISTAERFYEKFFAKL
jgi:ADP-ribosylglycohydrolase